ncbi:protein of unknown function [Cupriavidus taiwanensis]|nr:protein of unknown function [Cupriavidus taiwanensis]
MRGLVGQVGEEWLAIGILAGAGIDIAQDGAGIEVRRIEVGGIGRDIVIVLDIRGRAVAAEVIAAAAQQRIALLEAPRDRRLARCRGANRRTLVGAIGQAAAEVPLAGHVGVIAAVLEQLRDRQRAVVQVALVAGNRLAVLVDIVGVRVGHGALADQVVVGPGDDHRTRDRAHRGGVVVGQQSAVAHQLVQVGRADLAAESAQVRIAKVIGHDEQDIGPLCRLRLRRLGGRRLVAIWRAAVIAAAASQRQRAQANGGEQVALRGPALDSRGHYSVCCHAPVSLQ